MPDIVSFFVSSSEPRVGGGGGEVVKPVTTGDPNQILTSDYSVVIVVILTD